MQFWFHRLWHSIGILPPWFLPALVLAVISPFVLRKNRRKSWVIVVWAPLTLIAVFGTIGVIYVFLSLNHLPNDAAGGFLGLGLVLIGIGCSPFLLLLFFCIKFSPERPKKDPHEPDQSTG